MQNISEIFKILFCIQSSKSFLSLKVLVLIITSVSYPNEVKRNNKRQKEEDMFQNLNGQSKIMSRCHGTKRTLGYLEMFYYNK